MAAQVIGNRYIISKKIGAGGMAAAGGVGVQIDFHEKQSPCFEGNSYFFIISNWKRPPSILFPLI